jgi:hypothetical protein
MHLETSPGSCCSLPAVPTSLLILPFKAQSTLVLDCPSF